MNARLQAQESDVAERERMVATIEGAVNEKQAQVAEGLKNLEIDKNALAADREAFEQERRLLEEELARSSKDRQALQDQRVADKAQMEKSWSELESAKDEIEGRTRELNERAEHYATLEKDREELETTRKALVEAQTVITARESSSARKQAEIDARLNDLISKEEETQKMRDKLASLETALRMREEGMDKSVDEYKGVLEEIAVQKSGVEVREKELTRKTAQLEENVLDFSLLQEDVEKERQLLAQKDAGLEQLKKELENWRKELQERREKLEDEVRQKVALLAQEMKPALKPPEVTEDSLLRKELEIRAFEESVMNRERDLETKERTIALEMERLEKERVEIRDLWESVEGTKKGLSTVVDEKTVQELARRKAELDDMYLKLSQREEKIRRDEEHIEGEWSRLQLIEGELSDLAKVLKAKEEEVKKLESQAQEQG